MRTLLILRHGKAENRGKETMDTDFPRTLTSKGRAEATAIGERLAQRGVQPDLIVTSTARRAYQTAALAAAELPEAAPITPDKNVYYAELDTLLDVVRGLPDSAGTIVIVGHNPGFEELTAALTGQETTLPTGGLACVTFDADAWARARQGTGKLAWTEAP